MTRRTNPVGLAIAFALATGLVLVLTGFFGRWSPINCWHEEIDLYSGTKRTTWLLLYMPVRQTLHPTLLTEALKLDGTAGEKTEWVRVNTFAPFNQTSPHYSFHGAFTQIQMLGDTWQVGRFSSEARAASANCVLKIWREQGFLDAAESYIDKMAELAHRKWELKERTDARDIEAGCD